MATNANIRIVADANALIVQIADATLTTHYQVCTSNDARVSHYDGAMYKASKAAVMAAFSIAFPHTDPNAMYDRWSECNEDAAYVARIVDAQQAERDTEPGYGAFDELVARVHELADRWVAAGRYNTDTDETPLQAAARAIGRAIAASAGDTEKTIVRDIVLAYDGQS